MWLYPHGSTAEIDPSSFALFGYDCQSESNISLATVSLSEVEECVKPEIIAPTRERNVQILQTVQYRYIEVLSCGISITRQISHCGMHSHSAHVRSDEWVKKLSPQECTTIHQTKRLDLYGQSVNNVAINASTHATMFVAGRIGSDGSCKNAEQFIDWDTSFKDVLVEVRVKMVIYTSMARLDIQGGVVHLRSGVSAPYRDGTANDIFTGQSFWQVGPPVGEECTQTTYNVLYQGVAKEVHSSSPVNGQSGETYVIVDDKAATFAVKLLDDHNRCGQTIFSTEHPYIFVAFTDSGNYFFKKSPENHVTPETLTFFQSKLQFMEIRSRQDMQELHLHNIQRRCELERDILYNKLAALKINPEAAGQLLYSTARGIETVVRGETLVSRECNLVEVPVRRTYYCYNSIPVTYQGKDMFIAPHTHILVDQAEETPCARAMPNIFEITAGYWMAFNPTPMDVSIKPTVLKPTRDLKLNFTKIRHVANRGIFSLEEMRDLERSLMFPFQRGAVSAFVTNSLLGHAHEEQFDPLKLFGPKEMEKIAKSTLKKVYGWLSEFGIFSSGIIGIICILQIIKYFFSVGLRFFHLHREIGCSIYLCSAFISSVSYCLLHDMIKKGIRKEKEANEKVPESPPPPTYQAYEVPFTFPEEQGVTYASQQPRGNANCYPALSEVIIHEEPKPTAPSHNSITNESTSTNVPPPRPVKKDRPSNKQ